MVRRFIKSVWGLYPERGTTRGVSHVVAVALLVGIVVALSIVISYSAISLSGVSAQSPPNVVFETEYNDAESENGQFLNVTHAGGETIQTVATELRVSDARTSDSPSELVESNSNVIRNQVGREWTTRETLVLNRSSFVTESGGQELDPSTNVVLDDAVVRIIFVSEDGEYSTILYECRPEGRDCEE